MNLDKYESTISLFVLSKLYRVIGNSLTSTLPMFETILCWSTSGMPLQVLPFGSEQKFIVMDLIYQMRGQLA